MRRLLLPLLATLLAPVVFAQTAAPVSPRAIFFSEPNFKGDQLVVEAGAAVPDLAAQPRGTGRNWQGAIASFRLEGAPSLSAWHGANFSGDRLEAAASVADLYAESRGQGETWERAIASLRVATPNVTVVSAPAPVVTVVRPAAPPPTVVIVEQPRRPDPREVEVYIVRHYSDLFGREPDRRSLTRWRDDCLRHNWDEREFRDRLRRSEEFQLFDLDGAITLAYREILRRDPDPEGFRNYRRLVLDRGWTIGRVREDLRRSKERGEVSARVIITRAYQDLLHREPDAAGYANFENLIRHHGWDERRVRDAIFRSPEYREKNSGRR